MLSGRRRSADHNGWCWGPDAPTHFQGVLVQPRAAPVPRAGRHWWWDSTSCAPGAWFHLERAQDYSACQNTASRKAGLSSWLVSRTNQTLGLVLSESLHGSCVRRARARLYWANGTSYNMPTRLTPGQWKNSLDLDTGFELNCIDVNLA